jgi:TolB protein
MKHLPTTSRPFLALCLLFLLLAGCDLQLAVGQPTPAPTTAPEPAAATHTMAPAAQVESSEGATPAPAATQPPPPTPTRPAEIASHEQIGGRLLFVRNGDLYQISGDRTTQLTSTHDLQWPRWSPDGTRIAVVRRGDSFSELHILDDQGENLTQLTSHKSQQTLGSKEYVMTSIWAVTPAWWPDSSTIIYSADVTASNMALWLIEPEGGQPRQLVATADLGANIEHPVFSPDGTTLAFALADTTPAQIWTVDLETGGKTRLTDGTHAVYDPAWTPDGQLLTVVILEEHSSIWLIDREGNRVTQLVSKFPARAPTWSPDGTKLAFIGEQGGRFDIYVADITSDGNGGYTAGEPRRVTDAGDIDAVSGLSWTR